jgi:hypothetical protein
MSNPRHASHAPVTRRHALRAGAGLASILAAGVAPRVLGADGKGDAKAIVYGTGAHTYEVIDEWATRPAGKAWGNTHMVQELADGRILVHHTGPESVHIYDPDGKFIEAWGKEFAGDAHGMDLRKEGNEEFLYFAPTKQHRVVKTSTKGEVVFECPFPREAKDKNGKPCYEGPQKYVPTFIAFAPGDAGDFYVADGYGSHFVHRYNARGEYQATFGGPGTGEGELQVPHGIICDTRDPANPMICVADRKNVRLQWFTLDGKFVKLVTDELRHPCHFDQRGTDLLVPDLMGRVTIFDQDNKLVTHLGDNPDVKQRRNHGVKKEALVPGNFCTPHGAIWDRAGNIYVVEWLPYGRVTKLRHVG